MSLPAGYRLRAPAPGDLDAVADALIATELDEAGQAVLGTDFVRDEWSRVGFELAADAWVVVDGAGTIAGYVQAMREEPAVVECWGIVRPGHRGRGIGSSLLNLTEERADQLLAGLPAAAYAMRSTRATMARPRCSRRGACGWYATSGTCRST